MPSADLLAPTTVEDGPINTFIMVAAWAGTEDAVAAALSREGLSAPAPNRATLTADTVVMDAGPGKLFIETPRDDLCDALGGIIPPDMGAVTDLTDARVRIDISGPRAVTLLQKGCALDLRETALPVNGVAWTMVHHITVVLRRTEDGFALYPGRSFASFLKGALHD